MLENKNNVQLELETWNVNEHYNLLLMLDAVSNYENMLNVYCL
jgi:hypothetical protein